MFVLSLFLGGLFFVNPLISQQHALPCTYENSGSVSLFEGISPLNLCSQFGSLQYEQGVPVIYSSTLSPNPYTNNLSVPIALIIDNDFTISNSNIKFDANAQLLIQTNKKLTLKNTKLFSCTCMWKGVVMEANSSIITQNNTIISDAFSGIELANNCKMSCENTTFDRCDIGINFPYPGEIFNQSFGPIPLRNLFVDKFQGNKFQCSSNLLCPLVSQKIGSTGISLGYIKNSPILGTGNSGFQGNFNLFDNLMSGAVFFNFMGNFQNFRMKNIRNNSKELFKLGDYWFATGVGLHISGLLGNSIYSSDGSIWNNAEVSFLNCERYGISTSEGYNAFNYIRFKDCGVADFYCPTQNVGYDQQTQNYVYHELTKEKSIAVHSRGQAHSVVLGQAQFVKYLNKGTVGFMYDDMYNSGSTAIYCLNATHDFTNGLQCIQYNGTNKTHGIYIEDQNVNVLGNQNPNFVFLDFKNNKNTFTTIWKGNNIQFSEVNGLASQKLNATGFRFSEIRNLQGCNNATNNTRIGMAFRLNCQNWLMGQNSIGNHFLGTSLEGSTVSIGIANVRRANQWVGPFNFNAFFNQAIQWQTSVIRPHSSNNVFFRRKDFQQVVLVFF